MQRVRSRPTDPRVRCSPTAGRATRPRAAYAQRVRRKLARRERRPVAIGRRERPARLSPRGPHEHHASEAVPRELARKVHAHCVL